MCSLKASCSRTLYFCESCWKTLTWAVGVICEGHLEGMSIVEDVQGGFGVVLQTERLQLRVVGCCGRHDVNGRLTGSVCNGELLNPLVWPWKITKWRGKITGGFMHAWLQRKARSSMGCVRKNAHKMSAALRGCAVMQRVSVNVSPLLAAYPQWEDIFYIFYFIVRIYMQSCDVLKRGAASVLHLTAAAAARLYRAPPRARQAGVGHMMSALGVIGRSLAENQSKSCARCGVAALQLTGGTHGEMRVATQKINK